jgi:putative ABC transport system ATP-binding protein
MNHYPSQLSGGEQQRVAMARAFITDPKILFADEPTGNLDEENAHHLTELLFGMNKEQGTTLVLVTHNLELAMRTQRILRMKSGKLVEETYPTSVIT